MEIGEWPDPINMNRLFFTLFLGEVLCLPVHLSHLYYPGTHSDYRISL